MSMMPPWYLAAQRELGVTEIAGGKHNSRIVEYFAKAGHANITSDEVPWCSAFACAVMELSGIRSPNSLWALDWLKWGVPLRYAQVGCVVVLTREGGGHVAFFVRFSDDGRHVLLLGGNQANKVCYQWYPIERVRGYRWPTHHDYKPPEIDWNTVATPAQPDEMPRVLQESAPVPVTRRETMEDVLERLRDQGSRIITTADRAKKWIASLAFSGVSIGSFELTSGQVTAATIVAVIVVVAAIVLYFKIEKITLARVDDDMRGLHIGRKR